nr:unnamed protein product [Callosobruchus analis]
MLKMFVDTVPSFNGNSDTLPSFISSCDYMFNTFTTTDQTIQNYLIRVVQTKLVGRAQLLVECRTELTSWSSIKSALEQCFGDNRSLECLEQDLFLAAPLKNEPPMDFGKRLQVLRSSLAQKLTLSEPSSVIRTAMLKQYEGVCLRAFIRGLPGPLQTIIRLKNPDSLERALTYVVEEQNFQYTQNIFKQRPNNFNTPRFPSQQFQPFNNNIRFQPPVQQSQQTFQSAQNFPSQPINIQTVPVQRHFPTNREVLDLPKTLMFSNLLETRPPITHNPCLCPPGILLDQELLRGKTIFDLRVLEIFRPENFSNLISQMPSMKRNTIILKIQIQILTQLNVQKINTFQAVKKLIRVKIFIKEASKTKKCD